MKKDYSVNVTAKKIYNRKLFAKILKIVFLSLIVLISITYLFLYIIYERGNFTISLDKNMSNLKNVYLSEDGTLEKKTLELSATSLDYMDNISVHWLPENIDLEATGSHNGTNYIAYTFYTVNAGNETVNYWYSINIDDTIKNVDEAIRIRVYQNGKQTTYAKKNKTTNEAEKDTKKFFSKDIALMEQKKGLKPNEKDRYTIVIWIEGDDPDCTNDLLGGEIKMKMNFTEEHTN